MWRWWCAKLRLWINNGTIEGKQCLSVWLAGREKSMCGRQDERRDRGGIKLAWLYEGAAAAGTGREGASKGDGVRREGGRAEEKWWCLFEEALGSDSVWPWWTTLKLPFRVERLDRSLRSTTRNNSSTLPAKPRLSLAVWIWCIEQVYWYLTGILASCFAPAKMTYSPLCLSNKYDILSSIKCIFVYIFLKEYPGCFCQYNEREFELPV